MHPAVLRTLEFDRVREALARESLTALGRARADALEPSTAIDDVRARLDLTDEAVAFTRGGGSLAIYAPEDLPTVLEVLAVEDQPLEPLQLLGLARFVDSVWRTAASIGDRSPYNGEETCPRLSAIARRVASFDDEVRLVHRAIHASGEVNDDASPALRDLRESLRRQRGKLRSTLDGLMRGAAKYLQDQIVTDRNGRYVLVLRSEHREAMPGIVHGASASGASLYVEPMGTVDLNNEIVALAEREREEVRRILLGLTNAFRRRHGEFDALIDAAADVDELFAKVELARRLDGIKPEATDDGRLEFRGARHPLLIPAVRDLLDDDDDDASAVAERGEGAPASDGVGGSAGAPPPGSRKRPAVVVGTDLLITPPVRALVISGPNTGGKTVALKAAGLLAVMAQAGLLIPADAGSRFTPFATIFADIGDEQSISASLSTFSAHIANIVAMERALALPALVLLDEVGGGTDPIEGGALGTAIIDHFRRRGATVIATTHDDALKSYAATTAGIETAAFGFNPDTYAPTYRLIYGAPGRSLALEIAERLGIPRDVIAAARARRSGRESQLAEHLARVDRELAALERERQALEDARGAVAGEREALLAREAKLAEREAVLRRRMDDKLNERLREAREEVDRIVADLKGKAGSLVRTAGRRGTLDLSTGEIGGLRADARAALEAVATRVEGSSGAAQPDASLTAPPDIGQSVVVAPFGAEGVVRAVAGTHIEVDVRGKRMRVKLSDLRKAERSRPADTSSARKSSFPQGETRPLELMLVGSTVDAALDRAGKFLDDALLGDARRLRVVHGHGTGKLRDALRRYFREHPLVASVAPAPNNEGGEGATIVELKD